MKKIRIAKSRIAGLGVFADEDISKGEFLVTMKGKLFFREYRKRSDYRGEENFVPVTPKLWIDPKPPLRYINHSCNPNTGFKTPRRVYALRNIKKGEELTLDYSTIEFVDFWDMPCNCGSRNCRKIIRSIQFLPLGVFKSYLPYIPRFFQEAYARGRKNAKIKI